MGKYPLTSRRRNGKMLVVDKELAIRLMNALEKLYVENLARKTIMKRYARCLPPEGQIDQIIEDAQNSRELRAIVAEQFAPVRAQISQDAPLEQVLQEFLRLVPTNKDVN